MSHNMTAVSNLCQRAILLDMGDVIFDGDIQSGVRKYLSNVDRDFFGEDIHLKINNLPEDPVLKLLDFYIDQPGHPSSSFLSDQDISVTIIYTVHQPVNGLRVGFDLILQESGSVVFRSFFDDAESSKRETRPGTYISIGIIPANLLTAKTYIVSLSIGIHNIRWIVYEQVASPLIVVNIGGVNSNYADVRPGMIMPQIQWTTLDRVES